MALVNFGAAAGSQWLFAFQNEAHALAEDWTSLGLEAGILRFFPGESDGNPTRGVWILVAATKSTPETSMADFYTYRYDTKAFTHQESAGSFSWMFNGPPAEIQFGRWNSTEQFTGKYAAAAIYGSVLTGAEIKSMAEGPSVEAWLSKSPKGLWMFNQASTATSVTDATGNGANQISLLGTSVVAEEPPIPYTGEGGGEESPTVKIKSGGSVVSAKRFVKVGGVLVPA